MSEHAIANIPDAPSVDQLLAGTLQNSQAFAAATLRAAELGVQRASITPTHIYNDHWNMDFWENSDGFKVPRWVDENLVAIDDGLGNGPMRYLRTSLLYLAQSPENPAPLLDGSMMKVNHVTVQLYGSHENYARQSKPRAFGSRDLLQYQLLFIDIHGQAPFVSHYARSSTTSNGLERTEYTADWLTPKPLTEPETAMLTKTLRVVNHYLGQSALLLEGILSNL